MSDNNEYGASDAARPLKKLLPPLTAAGLLVAMIVTFSVGLVARSAVQSRGLAVDLLTHTFEVNEQFQLLLSRAKDAETGQRGYILTGAESYLDPYNEARRSIDHDLATLRQMVADNPAQLRRVDVIDKTLQDKLAELQRTIDLRSKGELEAAMVVIRNDSGRLAMVRLRTLIEQALDSERALMSKREAESERTAVLSGLVSTGGAAVIFALLVILGYLASRDFRALDREAWLQRAQARLASQMHGDQRLEQLCDSVLTSLVDLLGAQVGALYLAEPDESRLRRVSAHALSAEAGDNTSIRAGEGVAGQALKDKRLLYVADFPPGYLRVASTFGGGAPRHVIAAPLRVDGTVNAVVELGLFKSATSVDFELLQRMSAPIGLAIRVSNDRLRLESLLEETQRQSEELQSQQTELETRQAELEAGNEEMNQTNALMEVQTHELERQRDDLQRAREVADKASRYKSEFLANMSHELRTPLNSTLILSRLLAENREGNLNADQIRSAETIYDAGNDLLVLINDILDLAKIEAGRVEIIAEPVAVVSITEGLEQFFRAVAQQKHLDFRLTRQPDCPKKIVTDRRRLEQVIKNLLSNAFKFTEAGSVELIISAEGTGRIRFAVRDSGIGIPPDKQDVIFEAFRQADGTTSRKYGGTGLGLSISRELARLLGGEIEVQSVVGKGSTFSLVVPIEGLSIQYPAVAPQPESRAVDGPLPGPLPPRAVAPEPKLAPATAAFPDDRDKLTRTGRIILVVEDDNGFARSLYDLAHELDFDCVRAGRADEGIALARELQPSGILLDLGLPDVSGLSVLERLKRDPATRHIPIHIVSASDNIQTALELGAIGYALKPVAREDLATAMQKLQERHAEGVRRVLLVEDDLRQQESVRKLLSGQNIELIAAGSMKEALAKLEQQSVDCMVLDLSLPDGSGYDLLEKMAEGARYSFPPVIIYTGHQIERADEEKLRRYSRSIIVKGARSPERLLDEVTLFLHQVESTLAPEQRRMLADARQREAVFEGRRILIVEDDVRNVFALTKVLEPRGAKIEIARNGREALEVLARIPDIDLCLMDLMMPEMDGLTAIREIRKNPALKRLPILALTAKAMADDRVQALSAGANDYMAKPFEVDKLISLCRVWLPR